MAQMKTVALAQWQCHFFLCMPETFKTHEIYYDFFYKLQFHPSKYPHPF